MAEVGGARGVLGVSRLVNGDVEGEGLPRWLLEAAECGGGEDGDDVDDGCGMGGDVAAGL